MSDNSYLDEEEWKKAKRMLIFRSIVKMDNGNKENINNAIDALNDPQYLLDNPRMKGFTEILSNALNAYKRGDNEEYERIISSLKENHHTARRKLAKCLQDKALFETTVNVPDLTRLVPDNIQDKRKGYTRVAQYLRDYYNNNEVALSEDAKELFNATIEAYETGDINKINTLNELVRHSRHVGTLFLIEKNRGYGIHCPYKEIEVIAKPHINPRPRPNPVRNTQELDGYTSDEWNQLLTIASQTAINQRENISEGLAVTVLKDILGNKFPENWKEMTLDEHEAVIGGLNPAQIAKFNTGIVEKAENLAELLPPHFLSLMANNADRAIEKASDNEKDILQKQRDIIIKAMASQIEQFNGQTVDSQNAAGVYDGANEMLDYLSKSITDKKLPQGVSITKEQIDNVKDVLKTAIKAYDEDNGLNEIDEKDAVKIEKTYDVLANEVKQVSDENKFNDYLDDDTKSIFEQLEFPETRDEQGNTVSAEENKKLFIEKILYTAAQKASVTNKDETDTEKLKKAFKEAVAETALLETVSLIEAQEVVDAIQGAQKTIYEAKTAEEKKAATKEYLSKFNGKINIGKDALSGYFAEAVNRQSLFTNRLATKLKNRGAGIFKKMWKPFEKIDKSCIQRFGKAYTIPRGIFARSLTNLPWSFGNSVLRVAAFSQVGTPWGIACVAGYGVYSLASTGLRMWHQYKVLKKQDPQLTSGKFFKHNWSGIALSLVGTAASVIPGLSSGVEALQGVTDWMKDSGLLSVSSIPGAEQLKMTNLSTIMIGAGFVDSTVKGTIAHHKNGKGLLSSIMLGATNAGLSSAVSIGTSMACAYGANELWQTGMNMGADTRTVDSNDSSSELTRDTSLDEALGKFEGQELQKLQTDIQNLQSGELSQEQYNKTLEDIKTTLAEKGLTLEAAKNGEQVDLSIRWGEQEAGYADLRIKGPDGVERSVTEHADFWAADWQKDVPGLHDSNVNSIETNETIKAFNEANPLMAVNPSRMEMIIMLCGGQAVPADADTHVNYNQYGDNVDVRGNHRCITEGWLEKYSNDPEIIKHCDNRPITVEEINAIRGLHDQNGNFQPENLSPRILAVINALDHKVSANFEVGDLESTRAGAFNDGVLSNITTTNEDGEHIHADEGKGDRYNTYANAASTRDDKNNEGSNKFIIKQHQNQYFMPHNPSVDLYNFVAKQEGGMAKIMGQNAKAVDNNSATRNPIEGHSFPNQIQTDSTQPSSTAASRNAQGKKGNFFTRLFSKNKEK